MFWVALRCTFQCRACGHLSPLNYLDLDGSVLCFSCGLDQAFARSSWVTALEHAHGVADLCGSPEGKHPHPRVSIAEENPFQSGTSFSHQQSGLVIERGMQVPTTLNVEVTARQPSCQKCNVALVVQKTAPLHVRTQCPRCGEARSYALPPHANGIVKGLCAEISDEHGDDRPFTRIEADALRCPNCGGSLNVNPGEKLANCPFCRTTSRLPQKTMYRGGGSRVEAETWYLAFEGPSAMRKRLERAPDAPLGGDIPAEDKKLEDPPKPKTGRPGDMLLVIALPILMLVLVGGLDLLLSFFLDFEIALPF
jgi:hypothetical protein